MAAVNISGMPLLQAVAERIISRWLEQQGVFDVAMTAGRESLGGRMVDLTFTRQGAVRRVKVKPDPYFGVDPVKVANRSLAFYRADMGAFAVEAVANAATREPGWMFESAADDLYYYYLAIAQDEDEVRALVTEPDEVFFSELAVDRDELVVMPMAVARQWFEQHYEDYTPRPVMVGGASAWYRLVPRPDIERAVPGITVPGPIFRLAGR